MQGVLVVGSVLFLVLGGFGYLGRLWAKAGGSVEPMRNSIYGLAWPLLMPRAKWLVLIGLVLAIAATINGLLD